MSDLGGLNPERYEIDEIDGLPREIVGSWVQDKHARLRKYVDISRGVRQMFRNRAGATFIDLFAGSGRARIRDTREVISGSSLAAWEESVSSQSPFTRVLVADADPVLLEACKARLSNSGAPVHAELGYATETIDRITRQIDPYGLHLAFLDPFNLGSIAFDIIRKLAAFKHMDILIHVSAMELQRNLRSYIESDDSQLDEFAPGWRDEVDVSGADEAIIRGKILAHWRNLLHKQGMSTTEYHELVSGSANQRLYWLAFAARHERALEFWQKIRDISPTRQLRLL